MGPLKCMVKIGYTLSSGVKKKIAEAKTIRTLYILKSTPLEL